MPILALLIRISANQSIKLLTGLQEDEPVPDEPSDRGEDGDEGDDDEGVNDLSKDKLIKAVKPKGAGKGKAKDKDVKPKGRK